MLYLLYPVSTSSNKSFIPDGLLRSIFPLPPSLLPPNTISTQPPSQPVLLSPLPHRHLSLTHHSLQLPQNVISTICKYCSHYRTLVRSPTCWGVCTGTGTNTWAVCGENGEMGRRDGLATGKEGWKEVGKAEEERW
jgi:hypothetical protein